LRGRLSVIPRTNLPPSQFANAQQYFKAS